VKQLGVKLGNWGLEAGLGDKIGHKSWGVSQVGWGKKLICGKIGKLWDGLEAQTTVVGYQKVNKRVKGSGIFSPHLFME